jgi:hypothetical protein
MKLNCWDFKKCGRSPEGTHASDLGICPVATHTLLDGMNSGKNAGRACWFVTESLRGSKPQGNEEQKCIACWECDFLKLVIKQENPRSSGFAERGPGWNGCF